MSDHIQIEVRKKHTPWKNQLRFTPAPKTRTLIEGMNGGEEPVSETINFILTDYFNKMPADQRQRLIAKGKNHY
jgi:hypothetical protein